MLDEGRATFFQIKPRQYDSTESWKWVEDRVVFMNDAFNLDNIDYITAVYRKASMYFLFDVMVDKKLFTYEFDSKATALKAQRELTRAWTKTGEFACVKEEEHKGSTGDNLGRT